MNNSNQHDVYWRAPSSTWLGGQVSLFVTLAALLALFVTGLTAPASAAEPVTAALIVTGDGNAKQAAKSLVDLLTAELAGHDELRLLEREQLDAVLAEQTLSLSGAVNQATAVRAGQLLGAELLVLLTPVKQGRDELVNLRLIETRSGIILDEQLHASEGLVEAVPAITASIRTAAASAGVPLEARDYLGVVHLQSGELSDVLDPMVEAWRGVLTHDLRRIPGVIVLEREHLERLQREENLSDLELALRRSTRVLEGSLTRDGGAVVANLRLTHLGSGAVEHVTARAEQGEGEWQTLRAKMRDAVAAALARETDRKADAVAPAQEAKVFIARAESLLAHQRWDEAGRLLEVAVMLTEPGTVDHEAARRAAWRGWQAKTSAHRIGVGWTDDETLLRSTIRQAEHVLHLLQFRDDRLKPGQGPANWRPPEVTRLPQLRRDTPELRPLKARAFELTVASWWLTLEQIDRVHPDRREQVEVRTLILGRLAYAGQWHLDTPEAYVEFIWPVLREFEQLLEAGGGRGAWFINASYHLLDGYLRKHPDHDPAAFTEIIDWAIIRPHPFMRYIGYRARVRRDDSASREAAVHVLRLILNEFPNDRRLASTINNYQETFQRTVYPYLIEVFTDPNQLTTAVQPLLDEVIEQENRSGFSSLMWLFHYWLNQLDRDRKPAAGAAASWVLDQLARPLPESFGPEVEEMRRVIRGSDIQVDERHLPPDPWQAYELRELVMPQLPDDLPWLSQLVPHEDHFIAILAGPGVLHRDGRGYTAPIAAARWRPAAGRLTLLGRTSVSWTTTPGNRTRTETYLATSWHVVHPWPMQVVGDRVVLAAKDAALVIFDGEQSRTFTIDDGLPSDTVRTMTQLNGQVYLSFIDGMQDHGRNAGALARLDPATAELQLLASSLAVKGASPLDGEHPYQVWSMVGDLQRNCVWIMVRQNEGKAAGLWRYEPATARFEHLLSSNGPPAEGWMPRARRGDSHPISEVRISVACLRTMYQPQ